MAPLVIIAALAGGALAQDGPRSTEPFVSENIEAFAYGIYCAEPPSELQDAPGTAAGVVNLVEGLPEFIVETMVVPAEIGLGFGVHVLMAPGASADPVVVTITHPPYPDSGIEVEQWVSDFQDDDTGLVGFSFETARELVPGAWTIAAVFEDVPLFEITFDVVPAALAPEIAGQCSGAFFS